MNIKNIKINGHLIKLVASGAILAILGVGAYQKSKPISKEYDRKKLRGIDVSSNQEKYDWDRIDKSFDYIIIKTSKGTEKDKQFEETYKAASEKDMDIGLYIENNTWKSSVDKEPEEYKLIKYKEEVNNEIDSLFEIISNKNPRWPIYLKLDNENLKEELPEEYAKILLDTFKDRITSQGYKAGVFAMKDDYDYLKTIDPELPNKFATWVAEDTKEYRSGQSRLQIVSEHDLINNNKDIKMIQAYKYVENTGARDILGTSPVNYSKVDYYYEPLNYPVGLMGGVGAVTIYNEIKYYQDKKKKARQQKLNYYKEQKHILEEIKKEKQQIKTKKEYTGNRKKQRSKKRKSRKR